MQQPVPPCNQTNVNFLVSGYSRNKIGKLSNNKYLASSILDVVTYYVPKMNGYSFIWKITNYDTIQQIINSKNKQTFDSDVFDCGLSNKFFLQIAPNITNNNKPKFNHYSTTTNNAPNMTYIRQGSDELQLRRRRSRTPPHQHHDSYDNTNIAIDDGKSDGSLKLRRRRSRTPPQHSNISLNLMSFPLSPCYKNVIFHCELYFHQINMQYSTVWKIKNKNIRQKQQGYSLYRGRDNRQYDEDEKEDNTFNKFAWRIHANLADYRWSEMTFECKINILKIVPFEHVIKNRHSYYENEYDAHKNKNKKTMKLYSYGSIYDQYGSLNNKLRFQWEINNGNGMINKITAKTKGIIQYHSDVFYDIFQLKVSRENDLNRFIISIVGLPQRTHKMGVKLELFAMDMSGKSNNNKIKIISSIVSFSYTSHSFILSRSKNELLIDLLLNYNKLTLFCTANIIQKYDEQNNCIATQMKAIFDRNITVKKEEKKEKKKREKKILIVDNMEEIRKEIILSKEKIVSLDSETFVWHITKYSDNGLLDKLKGTVKRQTFNSDIFVLFGCKWYISIYVYYRQRHSGRRRRSLSESDGNGEHNNKVSIFVNCIMYGSINWKVSYELLQTGAKCEFYDNFDGHWRRGSLRPDPDSKVLSENVSAIKLLNEMTIKIKLSLISDYSENRRRRGPRQQQQEYNQNAYERKYEREEIENNNKIDKEVIDWLCDTVKLPQYIPVFRQEAIEDLNIVKLLTLECLNKMGIVKIGHQLKILRQIDILKAK